MKHIKRVLWLGLLTGIMMTSCEKMMEVSSDRFITSDNHKLDNPNDTLYSMWGILAKMQALGDQYVVLGEMRGDLMDVTVNSDEDLRELNNLNVSEDNSWIDVTNYYVVINHCNYLITNIDTSLYLGGSKVMMREYAGAKAIRAWVYLQLALNFGKAYYVTTPILTIEEAKAEYEMIDKDAILDSLIADLKTVENLPLPSMDNNVGGYDYSSMFPSVKYLLGEIYLWQNKYELAAQMYYESMLSENRYIASFYRNAWANEKMTLVDQYWTSLFTSISEMTMRMCYYYNPSYGNFTQSRMDNMCVYDYTIAPSQRSMDIFEKQVYTDLSLNIVTTGDLRGDGSSYKHITKSLLQLYQASLESQSSDLLNASDYIKIKDGDPMICIYEYYDCIYLQRTSLAYLRYAEAVNRLNKPTLALAVINYGLKSGILSDTVAVKVNPSELASNESWMDFSYAIFEVNSGIRPRGMGASTIVSFPSDVTTMEDSVNYVESIIVEELALETAYEGNRFHDLMRISQHNQNGENDVIASAIAMKFQDDYDAVYKKMQNSTNWYLPFPSSAE